jgi:hypothetical protein
MKKRPWGVTILSCIAFFNVAFYLVLAVRGMMNVENLRSTIEGMSAGGTGPMLLLRLGPLLPFYFLLMAILLGALGWGLWTLKNWARLIVLALIGLSLVGAAVEIIHGWPTSDAKGIAVALVRVVIALLTFWYLCLGPVRAAFHAQPTTVPSQ